MFRSVLVLLLVGACRQPADEESPVEVEASTEPTGVLVLPEAASRDLTQIRESGTLRVALPTDSTSYFLYRNLPMGFEYDVLVAFAEAQSLSLDVHVIQGREERLAALAQGTVDVAGGRLSQDLTVSDSVTVGAVLFESPPLAVQAKPGSAPFVDDVANLPVPSTEFVSIGGTAANAPSDLVGREIWVQSDSQWIGPLSAFESTHGDVTVVGVDPTVSTETLIRWVAGGHAPYTVASEDLATLKSSVYENLHLGPAVGPPTPFGLATGTTAPGLAKVVSDWTVANAAEIERLHRRYYEDRTSYRERLTANPLSGPLSQLSDYDDLFKTFATQIGWDWRLVAAQSFLESGFDPNARSWSGAQGLMQLMPATSAEIGVTNPLDPSDNIDGAIRYLVGLDERLRPSVPDDSERIAFVLASYNAGLGHVEDAQRLAVANGEDPASWEVVAVWLAQLSRSEVYTQSLVEHGYCQGTGPVLYVERIMERFGHYERLVER